MLRKSPKSACRYLATLVLGLLFGLVPGQARLAVVSLDTGERIQGTILPGSTDSVLLVKSDLLGQVSVPRTRVLKIDNAPPAGARSTAVASAAKPAPQPPVAKKPGAPQPAPAQVAEKTAAKESGDRWFTFPEVPELPEFPENWQGNVRFGVNVSNGDTKWSETNIRGRLEITEEPRYYRVAGSYVYRENERADGSTFKSIDRYDANAIFRYSLNDEWFAQNSLAARADQRKKIDLELQDTVGVGYRYKPGKEFEFILGGGGGYEYVEAERIEQEKEFLPVLNIFQELTWRPWKRATLVQSFNYFWNPEDPGDYNYVWSSALRFRLNHTLGFELAFDRSFDNEIGPRDVQDEAIWRNAIIVYF